MPLEKGDISIRASVVGTKVEFDEYVLRTIQIRKGQYSWEKPRTWAYWWLKLPGVTWGKRSKRRGDFGFLPDADPVFREKRMLSSGRPYAATRLGAIKDEIASLRSFIETYGEDYDFDEEGVVLGAQLKAALATQKRLRGRSR